jgi:phenylacetyl-CoA:acceptor oxidoreductase subunit 1
MARYVMVVDLEKCTGCQTCVVACKMWNGLGPSIQRVTVVEKEEGQYPDVRRVYVPKRCMNCKDPQCTKVCPTGATERNDEKGIVTVDKDKCMGCRYCMMACPYNARTFQKSEMWYHAEPSEWEKMRYKEHPPGIVDKCDFCISRLDSGLEKALTPGIDPDATPMCVLSCIASALYFGDIEDPESNVSKIIQSRGGFRLLPEMETDPSIYYLPKRTGNEADQS